MNSEEIKRILNDVKEKKLSTEKALDILRDLPFKDLGFAKLDLHRDLRRGFGEVIYAKSKSVSQLSKICLELKQKKVSSVIFSRIGKKKAKVLLDIDKDLKYNETAKIVYKKKNNIKNNGTILVLSAGTSDIPVAEEAALTAEIMGSRVNRCFDVGIAGLHRVLSIYEDLRKASVIIVVAGMEGALPSVVSGLVSAPVIAVPTSVGYGANLGGVTTLLAMANSCSPGVVVVNVDNGFGAGYFASTILKGNTK